MSRIYAYCRVSTLEQTTKNQRREIESAGFNIKSQQIIEEQISGSAATSERPGFNQLLDRLKRGDALIVTKLDRLGCNPMDISKTVEQLTKAGIKVTLDEACQFLKISRPTATNWIRTGRLQATRKDPTKPKSPYLTTRQACIAALQSPLHTVQVSAGDGITEERKCHSSAEMKYGMPRIRSRAGNELRNLLAQRTSGKLRSCTTSEKQNSGE
ncbi:recombinase family protein [Escherichia coli]|nr:recombinase family protein [Escherichia coli]